MVKTISKEKVVNYIFTGLELCCQVSLFYIFILVNLITVVTLQLHVIKLAVFS